MTDIPVPPEAVTVAHDILWGGQMSEDLVRRALEVAAPYIRAGERERILALLDAWRCSCGEDDCSAYDTRDQIAALIGDPGA